MSRGDSCTDPAVSQTSHALRDLRPRDKNGQIGRITAAECRPKEHCVQNVPNALVPLSLRAPPASKTRDIARAIVLCSGSLEIPE